MTTLTDISAEVPSETSTSTTGSSGATAPARYPHYHSAATDQPMVLAPAGFIGDLLSGLTGALGEVTGGLLGNAQLGREIGDAAAPVAKLLPFQVVPPSLAPAAAGPGQDAANAEALVVVPAGFIGGILGGLGGNLIGGAIGDWLGDKDTGGTVGSSIGGVLGGLLPFQVVPPQMMPASAEPNKPRSPDEAMVVVPAGFFGDLLSGVSGAVGNLIGGSTGQQIGSAASPFLKLLPFQALPDEYKPASTGPATGKGSQDSGDMVVLPAGFFGNLLSGVASTVGGVVGGLFGDSQTGQSIGAGVAPILNMLPFHAVPPSLVPQSTGPGTGGGKAADPMMFVPASLFGSLMGAWGGLLCGTPDPVSTISKTISDILPFSVVAPAHA